MVDNVEYNRRLREKSEIKNKISWAIGLHLVIVVHMCSPLGVAGQKESMGRASDVLLYYIFRPPVSFPYLFPPPFSLTGGFFIFS
jgi:hypothetical protein